MAWLPRREKAAAETRMSSIAPVGSIPYQPPVVPVQPVRAAPDQVAQRNAEKGKELMQTAVAAQSAKEAGKGLVLDIQV